MFLFVQWYHHHRSPAISRDTGCCDNSCWFWDHPGLPGWKFDKRDHNAAMALSGILLVGTAAMASSNNNTATSGAVAAIGAASISAGMGIAEATNEIQYGYGENHIMGGEIRIPSKLFIRKSILFENKYADKLVHQINICLKMPTEECVKIPISRDNSSNRPY